MRYMRIQGRMHIFEKMAQIALNHVLTSVDLSIKWTESNGFDCSVASLAAGIDCYHTDQAT